jgi:hypothetical protein
MVQKTKDFINNPDVNQYIIILGWFVAPFINLVVNGWWMTLRMNKKEIPVPKWLLITNFIFLIIQVFKHIVFA